MKIMHFKLLILFIILLAGCKLKLEHSGIPTDINLNVQVGIDDLCLACFPSCDMDGFSCTGPEGIDCSSCVVGCLGGLGIQCRGLDIDAGEEDPRVHCWNTTAGINIQVPSVCVRRDNFITEVNIDL